MKLESVFPNIRFYTFLRKPLERCASDYQFRVRRGGLQLPFKEWIKSPHARNHQVRKLAANGRAKTAIRTLGQKVQFVGLTERFHESLVMFRQWSGYPKIDIRYDAKNVASENSIKQHLLENADTRQMLIEANREDLQLYAAAAKMFAKQQTTYGESLAADVELFEWENYPVAKYPRQVFSMLKREVLFKPAAERLSNRSDPKLGNLRRAA